MIENWKWESTAILDETLEEKKTTLSCRMKRGHDIDRDFQKVEEVFISIYKIHTNPKDDFHIIIFVRNLNTAKCGRIRWWHLCTEPIDFFDNSIKQIELIELIRQISTGTLIVI